MHKRNVLVINHYLNVEFHRISKNPQITDKVISFCHSHQSFMYIFSSIHCK